MLKVWKFVNQLELSELKLKYIFWLITIISLYEIQLHAWLRLLSVNWNLKLDLQTFFRMIQMQFTFVLHRLTIIWSRTKLFFKFVLRKKTFTQNESRSRPKIDFHLFFPNFFSTKLRLFYICLLNVLYYEVCQKIYFWTNSHHRKKNFQSSSSPLNNKILFWKWMQTDWQFRSIFSSFYLPFLQKKLIKFLYFADDGLLHSKHLSF